MATSTQYEKISTEDIEAITTTQEANKMSGEETNRTSEEEMFTGKKFVTFRESGPPTLNLPETLLKASSVSEYCAAYQDMTSHGYKSEQQIVKPLKMKIELEESPVQFHPVLSQIEELSDGKLWLFDKLTISPPASQLKERLFPDKNQSTDLKVFIAPNPNEMRQLATGPDGSLKRLNEEQHREIRRKGTFSVQSKNFPGAVHRWRITQLLQRGNEPANDDFKGLIARAYYFTFIVARNRVIGRRLSMKDAIENIGYAIYFVYNSLIGGQIRFPVYNLEEEMFKKLTEDLKVADPNQLEIFAKKLLQLCKFFKVKLFKTEHPLNSFSMSAERKLELENLAPNLYSNTNGDIINLFAVSPSWIGMREQKIFSKVTTLIKSEYPPKRVQKLIREYRDNGMADPEIVEKIKGAFNDEYLTALISSLRENAIENKSFPEKGEEVIETYLRGLAIIQGELWSEEERIRTVLEDTQKSLVENNPIRSKCNDWLNEKMEKARKVAEQNENSFQNVIQKLGENEAIGPEWAYFIRRSEEFHNSLPETVARLSKQHYTTHETVFTKWIWNPTNYIVTEVKTGKRKKDVKIVDEPGRGKREYNYSMTKKQVITVTSEYAGWRWRKYFVSFYTWFVNFLFVLLIGMVLKGPFSLSALLLWYKYPTNYELDSATGNVYPNNFGHTFVTLLIALWKNIIKRRTAFEQKPDTGFLPKNMTRVLNKIYLYVIFGFFGTLIFSLVFPTLCLLLITLSIVLVITFPIWYVALSIIIILFRTLIYDFQYEDGTDRNPGGKVFPLFYFVIYKLGIRVNLQLLVAVIIIVLMPVLSLFIVLIACVRRSLRFMWDLFTYVVVIKPRGRVPITNSFVARRISGPGLATNYYYQIHPSQALVKFEYGLEGQELSLYQSFMTELLNQPSETYSNFINNILRPLGYRGGMESLNESICKIKSQKSKLGKILGEKMNERHQDFSLQSPTVSVDRIRMVKGDLDTTVRIATQIIEEFYIKRILVYPNENRENIFSSKGLETDDWEGLAKIRLNNSFSPSFLAPLEESDESFSLQVEKFGLEDYFEALSSGTAGHDLDRERMITVDKQYTFLPGINLTPKYGLDWARNNCIHLSGTEHMMRNRGNSRKFLTRMKRYRDNVPRFLTKDFNDKLTFAEKLAARVGWKNILGDDDDVDVDADVDVGVGVDTDV